MQIETKFNIGDVIYLMVNDKIRSGKIAHIAADVKADPTLCVQKLIIHREYSIHTMADFHDIIVKEDELFPSKQDLLNHLESTSD